MADSFEIKVATQFAELEALSEEWHVLWQGSPRREVFSTLAWARAWWKTFGDRWQICSPMLFRSGRLKAVLPLVRNQADIRFLGYDVSDYNDILAAEIEPAETDALLAALDDLRPGWSRCTLINVPEHSHLVRYWLEDDALLTRRKHMTSCFHGVCPSTVFRGADRDRILAAIQRKKSLKRHRNKLQRLGEIQFEHLTDREAIRQQLPAFFDQHRQRRAMEGDAYEFFDAPRQEFYERLIEELDPRRMLRFGRLRVGDKPAAFHFGFEVDDRLIWYKPAFDVSLWSFSPGESLLSELYRYADAAGLGELDFTIGGEDFKRRFANEIRTNYRIEFFPRGAVGRAKTCAMRAREAVKSHPKLGPPATRLAKTVGRLLQRLQGAPHRNGRPESSGHSLPWYLYRSEELMLFSILEDLPSPEAGHLASPLEGRFIGLEELAAASRGERAALSLDLVNARKRLSQGGRCFAVYDRDKIAHLSWVDRAEVITAPETPGCRMDVENPSSVISDCRTAPNHRGRGISASVLRTLVRRELEDSRAVWIYCSKSDAASRRRIQGAGFKHEATFHYRNLLGRESTRVAPASNDR